MLRKHDPHYTRIGIDVTQVRDTVGERPSKPLVFLAGSLDDLTAFPDEPKRVAGYALRVAQQGGRHPDTKVMQGFKGASVLEVADDFDKDTYRTVYTVQCSNVIFVLHAFKKKSKSGTATPKADIDLVKKRYADALAMCKDPPPDLRQRITEYVAAVSGPPSASKKKPARKR